MTRVVVSLSLTVVVCCLVGRFDPDEPPRSYLQSREESMVNENEGSTAASPGTMLGRHLGRLNFPAHKRSEHRLMYAVRYLTTSLLSRMPLTTVVSPFD